MSTNNNKSAAVFITAGNKVEIVPVAAIRKLVSTATQHQLIVTDERNQPAIYVLDAKAFETDYIAAYERDEDEAKHLTDVSVALFRAVLEGKTFTVLAKHAAQEPAAA